MDAVSIAQRQLAREQHVGAEPARRREMVAQRFCLTSSEIGQPQTTGPSRDHAVETGVSIAVAHEHKPHHHTLRGLTHSASGIVAAVTSGKRQRATR